MPTPGLNHLQFRETVVRPVIASIGFFSHSAENLLVGIALTESELRYVKQIKGPACGPFQMEPLTHDDIYANFLMYKPVLRQRIIAWSRNAILTPSAEEMCGNWYYAAAMARAFLLRIRRQLPSANDPVGMAEYWKKYYNTHLGKGRIDTALPWFQLACEYEHGYSTQPPVQ